MTNTHRTSRQTHLTKAQIRALVTLTLVFVVAIAALIQECASNRKDSTGKQSTSAAAATTIAADPTKTTVRFLDIGQGDSTIVELPDGKTMVIDAGPRGSAKTIEAQLKADGRPQVDYLVATHPDADHIGGMAELIADADIKSIWAPNATNNTETFRNFLSAIDRKGLTITQAVSGTTIAKTDQYSIDILWPPSSAHFDDTNDYSIIIKLTVGEKTFLFTGDAPAALINQAVEGHIDVLKVSHHGSRTGTTKKLAAKLSPNYAVMSYAVDNDYGHPHESVLRALSASHTQVYGTGANGTVTAITDGSTINIYVQKEGTPVAPPKVK